MKKDMSRYTGNDQESKTYKPAMKERGCYLIAMRRFPSQASEGQGTLKGIAVWKSGSCKSSPFEKISRKKYFGRSLFSMASCAWGFCGDCWNGEGCAVRTQPRSMTVRGRVRLEKKNIFFRFFFAIFFTNSKFIFIKKNIYNF